MLRVVMLSVFMLSVVIFCVVMLNVIILSLVMLSVVMQNVILLSVIMLSVVAPKKCPKQLLSSLPLDIAIPTLASGLYYETFYSCNLRIFLIS